MAEGEKEGMPQPDPNMRVVDGITEHLRGGVWYKERKGSATSSTQELGIGDVSRRWTNGMEINSARQKGRGRKPGAGKA